MNAFLFVHLVFSLKTRYSVAMNNRANIQMEFAEYQYAPALMYWKRGNLAMNEREDEEALFF